MSSGDLGRLEIVIGIRSAVQEELNAMRGPMQQQVQQFAQGLQPGAAASVGGGAAGQQTRGPVGTGTSSFNPVGPAAANAAGRPVFDPQEYIRATRERMFSPGPGGWTIEKQREFNALTSKEGIAAARTEFAQLQPTAQQAQQQAQEREAENIRRTRAQEQYRAAQERAQTVQRNNENAYDRQKIQEQTQFENQVRKAFNQEEQYQRKIDRAERRSTERFENQVRAAFRHEERRDDRAAGREVTDFQRQVQTAFRQEERHQQEQVAERDRQQTRTNAYEREQIGAQRRFDEARLEEDLVGMSRGDRRRRLMEEAEQLWPQAPQGAPSGIPRTPEQFDRASRASRMRRRAADMTNPFLKTPSGNMLFFQALFGAWEVAQVTRSLDEGISEANLNASDPLAALQARNAGLQRAFQGPIASSIGMALDMTGQGPAAINKQVMGTVAHGQAQKQWIAGNRAVETARAMSTTGSTTLGELQRQRIASDAQYNEGQKTANENIRNLSSALGRWERTTPQGWDFIAATQGNLQSIGKIKDWWTEKETPVLQGAEKEKAELDRKINYQQLEKQRYEKKITDEQFAFEERKIRAGTESERLKNLAGATSGLSAIQLQQAAEIETARVTLEPGDIKAWGALHARQQREVQKHQMQIRNERRENMAATMNEEDALKEKHAAEMEEANFRLDPGDFASRQAIRTRQKFEVEQLGLARETRLAVSGAGIGGARLRLERRPLEGAIQDISDQFKIQRAELKEQESKLTPAEFRQRNKDIDAKERLAKEEVRQDWNDQSRLIDIDLSTRGQQLLTLTDRNIGLGTGQVISRTIAARGGTLAEMTQLAQAGRFDEAMRVGEQGIMQQNLMRREYYAGFRGESFDYAYRMIAQRDVSDPNKVNQSIDDNVKQIREEIKRLAPEA